MGPLDPEVLQGFYEEARNYVPGMERALAVLTADPTSAEATEELYRLAHSVGGASRMVGLGAVGEAASAIEALLEESAQMGGAPDPEYLPLLAEGLSCMKSALEAAPLMQKDEPPEFDDPNLQRIPADLLSGFLEESEEHLQASGEAFRSLESASDKKHDLREIRRGIHTIKGAAGMVGLQTVSRLAHRMEDLLDLLFDGKLEYSQERHDLLVATYDTLSVLVRQKGRVGNLGAHLKQLFDIYKTALSVFPSDEGSRNQAGQNQRCLKPRRVNPRQAIRQEPFARHWNASMNSCGWSVSCSLTGRRLSDICPITPVKWKSSISACSASSGWPANWTQSMSRFVPLPAAGGLANRAACTRLPLGLSSTRWSLTVTLNSTCSREN